MSLKLQNVASHTASSVVLLMLPCAWEPGKVDQHQMAAEWLLPFYASYQAARLARSRNWQLSCRGADRVSSQLLQEPSNVVC